MPAFLSTQGMSSGEHKVDYAAAMLKQTFSVYWLRDTTARPQVFRVDMAAHGTVRVRTLNINL